MKGRVEQLNVLAVIEILLRLTRNFHGPCVIMAEQNAHLSHHLGILDCRCEQLHFIADMCDFLEHSILPSPVMRQHPAVKFLRANSRLPEEKVEHAIRAPRNQLIREQTQDRKSTRLNSSLSQISYAVFCLKKKTKVMHRYQPY